MTAHDRIGEILDAAYVCFTRHGVRRTTMDDIAREAAMSRPAVYQYVQNKEDAFRRLAGRLLDKALGDARAAITSASGLGDQLAAGLETKLGMVGTLWRDSPAHAAELLGDEARLSAELISAYNTAMRELLAEQVSAARPAVDAVEFTEVLLAFTRGVEADLSDPDAAARLLRHGVALLVAGLDHSHPITQESA